MAFDNFDPEKVSAYTEDKLEALRSNPGIIRNRLKIQAAVTNAWAFLEIQKEYGSFSDYIWHWTDGKVVCETGRTSSELSDCISKDLKKTRHEVRGNNGHLCLFTGSRSSLFS